MSNVSVYWLSVGAKLMKEFEHTFINILTLTMSEIEGKFQISYGTQNTPSKVSKVELINQIKRFDFSKINENIIQSMEDETDEELNIGFENDVLSENTIDKSNALSINF